MLPFLALLAAVAPDLVTFNVVGAQRDAKGLTATFERDPHLRRLARAALARAFARYPAGTLPRDLDRVYVADDLRWDGTQMGGLSMPGVRAVWLAVGQSVDKSTARWFEASFHHEFAHVLFERREAQIPKSAWRALNSKGFRYRYEDDEGGFSALSKDISTDEALKPSLNAKGVLSDYGATEIDEDWATYAERLMDPEPSFLAAYRRYPRVRQKMRLMAGFYRRAFPGIRLREFDALP